MGTTVGIAIPAYGRGRHLRQTLDSVLAQTRAAKEIVVVDDCSPDETGEVARSLEHRGVQYIRNSTNLGVPENYNASLRTLSTDYVMILEDHDLLEPTFIQECAGLLDQHPNVLLVATSIAEIDEQTGKLLRVFSQNFAYVENGRRLAEYLVTNTTAPFGLTALIRRTALDELQPWFDQKYWWYADIDFWIRLALRGSFGCIGQPLLRMRRREPNHFLSDKDWEGLVCCDRIRRDSWKQVFPENTLAVRWKWARYCAARDYEGFRLLLSQLARGRRGVPETARSMFTPLGRAMASVLARTPRRIARSVRAAHRLLNGPS